MSSLKIYASHLGRSAKTWLTHSHKAEVLHLFGQVCNLSSECKEVLSIVTPRIGMGPFNVVLEKEIVFTDILEISSLVSIGAGQIRIGNLSIQITGAMLWNSRPNWEVLHIQRNYILNQLQRLQSTNYEFNPGSQPYNPLPSNLAYALSTADIETAKKIASRLAGLGIGLTPAADDFLMGAIYAAWIIHPSDVAYLLAQEIASAAAPKTTSLSAAWLRSAGRGEAGTLWHRFFASLTSETSIKIKVALDNILAIGATSGADALAGFTNTFRAWAGRAG